jgi:threonine dehydrogenase-like Zn-dependent dehydrogenase
VCPACAAGRYPWCRNFRSGDLPVSIHIGNCAAAAGAHAERFAAHESQLFAIPSGVSDEAAVLADPFSVSLRSVLLAPPVPGQPVLVYGSGTLAYAVIALVRFMYPEAEVWAATRPGARARLAERLGAHAVLSSVPNGLVAEVARRMGASPLVPWSGREWLQDGPGVVYDTIGSVETVETSLRLLMTGGSLVVSGVEPPKRFEWTPLYFKELRVVGSNGFGVESVRGVAKHAMLHYFDFVADGFDLTPVITHRFPLERWDEAVLALKDAARTGAVKVLLEPDGRVPGLAGGVCLQAAEQGAQGLGVGIERGPAPAGQGDRGFRCGPVHGFLAAEVAGFFKLAQVNAEVAGCEADHVLQLGEGQGAVLGQGRQRRDDPQPGGDVDHRVKGWFWALVLGSGLRIDAGQSHEELSGIPQVALAPHRYLW